MGVGDEILAAGQAQRYFSEHGSPSVIVGNDGLPRWHDIWQNNPAIYVPTGGELGLPRWYDRHHQICNGPNCRPYIVYPFTEDTGWTFNKDFKARDHIARIYLTDADLQLGRAVLARTGKPFILVEPWSKHANLRWPLSHWEEFCRRMSEVHRVVQHVSPGAPRLPYVEHVETTTFRQACSVLVASSLYVRGESGMCHAAAALDVPTVTIWGGCMDWDVLGGYPKQIGVGISEPCGRWRPCTHCKLAMYSIDVSVVERAAWTQLACYN